MSISQVQSCQSQPPNLLLPVSLCSRYESGPLVSLCGKFLGIDSGNVRALANLDPRNQNRLQRFLKGIRVKFTIGQATTRTEKRIKEVIFTAANRYEFEDPNHGTITVEVCIRFVIRNVV